MVPTGPLIAGLGEPVTITPAATGVAVPLRAIVQRTPAYTSGGDELYYRDWMDLPSTTDYAVGDAVVYRGRNAVITVVEASGDPNWTRYWVGR